MRNDSVLQAGPYMHGELEWQIDTSEGIISTRKLEMNKFTASSRSMEVPLTWPITAFSQSFLFSVPPTTCLVVFIWQILKRLALFQATLVETQIYSLYASHRLALCT